MLKDFQKRLKHHMDYGATYLEALHLLMSTEKKQTSMNSTQAIKQTREDLKKISS